MLKKTNRMALLASFLMTAGVLSGCIKPELPNAEADITALRVEGVTLLREPRITNSTVMMQVNAWDDRTHITPHFTLTEGATITPANDTPQDFTKPVRYKVTSQDGQWTKEYIVSVASPQAVSSEYSFEYVRLQDNKYHFFVNGPEADAPQQWESPNLGYTIGNPMAPAEDYPVCQDANGFVGKCARLTTKSTGALGAMFQKPLAAGSLFLGELDPSNLLGDHLKATRFGVPLSKKPVVWTGYYKYKAGDVFTDIQSKVLDGKRDIFDMYAVVYEVTDSLKYLDGTNALTHQNIVLMSRIKDAKETDEWTRFELRFEPVDGKKVDGKKMDEEKLKNNGYNIAIVMSSSKDGAQFLGAVGSTLMVDEIKVFYE